jgi:HKD family nuclease
VSEFFVQTAAKNSPRLHDLLKAEVTKENYRRISVCVAYASYRGAVLLRSLFAKQQDVTFRWLLGLDDAFTDPKAIDVAMGTRQAKTRLATLAPKQRFHPKIYLLDRNDGRTATLVVGSCNLSEAALEDNCEAYAVFYAQSAAELRKFEQYWQFVWKLGFTPKPALLKDYSKRYKRNRKKNPIVVEEEPKRSQPRKIKKAAKANLDNSTRVWIVLGRNTGGGGQLDVVKDLAPFLGLPANPSEGTTRRIQIDSPSGTKDYQLTFTKGMWRFMNLQQGFLVPLRPDLSKPSPYILVIERPSTADRLRMYVLPKRGPRARRIIRTSGEVGFTRVSVGGPSGRPYGWF